MDNNEARAILGVSESANKEEISKKYSVLLKRHKSNIIQDKLDDIAAKAEFNKINNAYNLLMGYIDDDPDKEEENEPQSRFSKKNVNNFFYYNKWKIVGIIALILIFGYLIKGFIFRVDNDLNVSFIGSISSLRVDSLKEKLIESIPGLKEPRLDMSTVQKEVQTIPEESLRNRAAVNIAMGEVDICIVDKSYFDEFCNQGFFMQLDDVAAELGIDNQKNELYYQKVKDDTVEHIYGINITSSEILNECEIEGKVKIFTISIRAKHYDNSVECLKVLLTPKSDDNK